MSKLESAASKAIVALDDWLTTYASDYCDEEKVKESWKRINERGGTLFYITEVRTQLQLALKENEQDRYHGPG